MRPFHLYVLLALLVVLDADDGEHSGEVSVGEEASSVLGLEGVSRVPGTHLLEVYAAHALHVDCFDRLGAPNERILRVHRSSW